MKYAEAVKTLGKKMIMSQMEFADIILAFRLERSTDRRTKSLNSFEFVVVLNSKEIKRFGVI